MKRNDEQTARIQLMESLLVKAEAAVTQLDLALNEYEVAQQAITALNDYYGSDEWKQDLADDEAGRLPQGLKRGVLSQDGIWNLLADVHEMNNRLQEMATRLAPDHSNAS